MSDFTHFNEQGRAKMVDVGRKPISQRVAVAAGRVLVNDKTFALIQSGGMKKGDVLTVAQIAGVMGAKRTPDIIPMCHPILMDGNGTAAETHSCQTVVLRDHQISRTNAVDQCKIHTVGTFVENKGLGAIPMEFVSSIAQ